MVKIEVIKGLRKGVKCVTQALIHLCLLPLLLPPPPPPSLTPPSPSSLSHYPTSKRSLGFPTAAKRYCHSATSVFLAQDPTVSRNSGNCLINSTTRGRRASCVCMCVCVGGGGQGGEGKERRRRGGKGERKEGRERGGEGGQILQLHVHEP